MEKVTKVFYYYTLLVLTTITIGSALFLYAPYNLVYPLVLSPSLIYLWLRVTDPVGATETTWSSRLAVVLVLLSSLGLLGFYLKAQVPKIEENLVSKDIDETASISAELVQLREELANIRETNPTPNPSAVSTETEINDLINSLASSTPSPTTSPMANISQGSVRVISQQAVNVYESNNSSSKITGIAEPKSEFEYTQKSDNWYLIEFENERMGWIQAKEVVEFN